jgi:hypothetical protein
MLGLMRRVRWFAGLLLLVAAQPAGAVDDAAIYALIDQLSPVAEAIAVDGNPADRGAIPAFADPSGDAGGDPSRDITSVRSAPTASALYVIREGYFVLPEPRPDLVFVAGVALIALLAQIRRARASFAARAPRAGRRRRRIRR